MTIVESVRWSPDGDGVRIIDQTQLPGRLVERDLRSIDDVCDAIARLAVRGAPAIGIAGAMGLVASLRSFVGDAPEAFEARLRAHAARIRATRPTAVNLPRALDRMTARASEARGGPEEVLAALRAEATALLDEDRAILREVHVCYSGFSTTFARVAITASGLKGFTMKSRAPAWSASFTSDS